MPEYLTWPPSLSLLTESLFISYNEVADELVKEVLADQQKEKEEEAAAEALARSEGRPSPSKKKKKSSEKGYDEKNIRRRVYDALNVLMAMDIISKEKKQITWKGLPSNAHHDLEMLRRERRHRHETAHTKTECLRELLVQVVCFRNLCRRNREREERVGKENEPPLEGGRGGPSLPESPPSDSGDTPTSSPGTAAVTGGMGVDGTRSEKGENNAEKLAKVNEERIPLPFIVVNTSSQAVIQCDMCPDRTDVMFDFSMPFEINDDNEILKRLGL